MSPHPTRTDGALVATEKSNDSADLDGSSCLGRAQKSAQTIATFRSKIRLNKHSLFAGKACLLALVAFTQSAMKLPSFNAPVVEYGRAGVVGALFNGGGLSCGGTYQATEKMVFHPTLPCGAQVKVYNPSSQLQVVATVTNNNVMFRPGYGRVADISIATAQAIGLNPDADRAEPVIIQPLDQSLASALQRMVTAVPSVMPNLPSLPEISEDTLTVLTRNLVAECGNCSQLGMLAVARVTLNRAEMNFMGANTIRKVVYTPYQFSWVKGGLKPSPQHGNWNTAKQLAEATLTDQVSGQGLGLFYRLGWQADHFYATHINSPKWAKSMQRIQFSTELEKNDLRHRYYASGKYTISFADQFEQESAITIASR